MPSFVGKGFIDFVSFKNQYVKNETFKLFVPPFTVGRIISHFLHRPHV